MKILEHYHFTETACKNPNCHSEQSEESRVFSFQVKKSKKEILRLTASG